MRRHTVRAPIDSMGVALWDLESDLPPYPTRPTGVPYSEVMLLVRRGSRPLGLLRLDLNAFAWESADVLICAKEQLGPAWDSPPVPMPALDAAPSITVAVATRERPEHLRVTLPSLLALDYPNFEVVVVDNAPVTQQTRLVVEDFKSAGNLRYVVETKPGLSRARNRGLEACEGSILAVTDDDIRVDGLWLRFLASALSGEGVSLASGLLLPMELDTPAQILFELFSNRLVSFDRRRYSLTDPPHDNPLFPFQPGLFGTGGSMAIRREAAEAIGGFDVALGAGTPARGGEDLDLTLRLILGGETVVTEPAAIGWHRHYRSMEDLRRQLYGYGVGLGALLTKYAADRRTALQMLRRLPPAARHMFSAGSDKNRGRGEAYPQRLALLELVGLVTGPYAYLRSRQASRSSESVPAS